LREPPTKTADAQRPHAANTGDKSTATGEMAYARTLPGFGQAVWAYVSRSPLHSLWNLEGVPPRVIVKNIWNSLFDDNLLGRAAELGFYFLFALFPTLFSACSLLGLAARSATHIYESLLRYLAIVVPEAALDTVLEIFNETTASSTTGKLTFGMVAAFWSASVGFSAIQGSLCVVYRVKDERPYWKARLSAIGITIILSIIVTLILVALLGADLFARLIWRQGIAHLVSSFLAVLLQVMAWITAAILLSLIFAVIYYFGPDVKVSRWHWLTPGSAIGILGWLACSFGFRLYLHFFNNYSATYGSLGTVIILLTWFYLSGLMLLLGGEINSEIEAAVKARQLAGKLTP
jgi:membrane protein